MGRNARAALWAAVLLAVTLLAGCGGGATTNDEVAREERTSGSERREHDDGSQITGLMGTIRRDQVENALNPRMNRFLRCFADRMGDVEYLAGNMRLSFRIHTDGTVAWVHASQTDVGDRPAEQCVLEVARSTHFPRPRGGEAEFSWGFGFDAPEDVRPPLNWQADAIRDQQEDIEGAARECHVSGDYQVTVYIAPGGAVQSAGGSTPSAEAEAGLDCILDRVRSMEMPDPGSYAAKVSFPVR